MLMFTNSLSKNNRNFLIKIIHQFGSQYIDIKKTKAIALNKKKDKVLRDLRKSIKQTQPIKPTNLYDQYYYRDVYKRMNIQLQAFFYQRPYNMQNFNFLLNLISEQKPSDYEQRIKQIIHKMNLLGMEPDQKSYTYMIKTAGNMNNPEKAELIFEQACTKFVPDKYFYTTLLQTYVNNNDAYMGLKILDQMKEKGIQPDLPAYTTLINCFRKGRKLEKCWQVHRKLMKSGLQLDETYTGVMLRVYAATHDAQKAVKLYRQQIEQKGVKPMIETINSYFKALSSRKQYANYVIDKTFHMAQTGQILTTQTFDWALRACSANGNIKSAGQLLKIMRIKKIEIQKSTFNILLKVYARACAIPDQDQQIRDVVIADSWKILEQMKKRNMVETTTLNNMLSVYANSINVQEIQGLILPLYEKFNKQYNNYTYEILIDMYFKLEDFNTAIRLWKKMEKDINENKQKMLIKYGNQKKYQEIIQKNNENFRPTFKALHAYLEIGIKMFDMPIVLDALEQFKKMNRMPKNQILKFLGNLKNLPQQIQTSLMDFQIRFGKAKITNKKHSPHVDDPQNK